MAVTKHPRPHPLVPRAGRWSGGEHVAIERMLADAAAFDLRAPELALVLGERASALAEAAGAAELWVRAESLVVSARVRIGLRAPTVPRAVAALRAAEDLGDDELAAGLRTDLAVCARSVGAPLAGLTALRQVLDVSRCSGAARAAALCHFVGCLYQFGQKPDLDRVLTEADRLCGTDAGLDDDGKLLARALVRVGVSAHRRRHGDIMGAADAARTGLGFLEQLEDPQADGGVVHVRLVLQLVCSLLDRGDTGNAMEIAQPVLDEPVRAASVAPAGWLRLAVATRILLPSGAVEATAAVLREGVRSTERHELHALTAQLWSELAHVEGRLGRPSEAIECLHRGHAEEHLHARARRRAVSLLSGEFGNGNHAEVDLDDVLGVAPSAASASAPPEPVAPEPVAAEPRVSDQGAGQATSTWTARQPAAAPQPVARQGIAEQPAADRRVVAQRAVHQEATHQPVTARSADEPAAEPAGAVQPVARQQPVEQPVVESETTKPSVTRFKVAPVVALRPDIDREQADSVTPLKSAKRPQRTVEDLPLAPAPADAPVVRIPLGFEALIKPKSQAAEPQAVEPEAEESASRTETRGQRRAREESAAKATTRHDSEHGSVAARSVLDRLGISAGGGGRRRAETGGEPSSGSAARPADVPEDFDAGGDPSAKALSEAVPDVVLQEAAKDAHSDGPSPVEELRLSGSEQPVPEREAPAASAGEPRSAESEANANQSPMVNENWLPRLKLPPSLAPFDESPVHDKPASTSETPFTTSPVIKGGELGDPFPAEHSGASIDDDLPPDAGLADLLARALAEHQAGTASAAALVKRLGGQNSGEEAQTRTLNGHGRNGDTPGDGRHRNGS